LLRTQILPTLSSVNRKVEGTLPSSFARLLYTYIQVLTIVAMSMISIRVDAELKSRMERKKDVNWSEVVRQALDRVLAEEEGQNLAKAVLLNERNVITPEEGYSSLRVIREGRGGIRWRR